MRNKVKGRFEPFTDYEIEEFLCGDSTAENSQRIEAGLADSAELAAYIAERRAQKDSFQKKHPTLSHDRQPTRSLRWPLAFASAAAAAIVILVFVLLPTGTQVDLSDPPEIRAMGAVKATLTVRRQGRTFLYREGVLLRPRDQVRLSIESPQAGFLTVLGTSGRGKIEIYYNALKTTPGTFTVPDSLVLDDQLNTEQWFVILAKKEVESDVYIKRLREKEALDAKATVIRIVKEATP
ncbi:MAG: hypothetical protein JRJ19_12875 [Deltaproteobacteria bacterium]|nr:hypothetical protein [Deltaproteobacteria bacterium]MBW1872956.1 hypothetical protein [Deltaproteobacteria bacterium]